MDDRKQRRIVWLLAVLSLGACRGAIIKEGNAGGDPSTDPTPGSGPPGSSPTAPAPMARPATGLTLPPLPPAPPPGAAPAAMPACKVVPGPRLLRRLTTTELNNTLQDVFQDPTAPQTAVLSDPDVLGFHVDAAQLLVRDLAAQQIFDFAEQTARWAVMNRLAALSPCNSMDPACRQSFIKAFGRRAFREPPTDTQVRAYDGLFAA